MVQAPTDFYRLVEEDMPFLAAAGGAWDVRDVYAEAKSNGYDTKTMRAIVRLRKMETHARQEADALLETYRQALGLA